MLLDPVDLLGATLGRYHVVKRGENLTLIAKRHGTTVSNLKIWNGLTSDVIIPGQKLYLRPQHSSLPLTTINRPRVNATKWKNIIAHHSATGNGNAKIFDAAHRRRGMENGLAYHFVICNGTNGCADGKVEVGTAAWPFALFLYVAASSERQASVHDQLRTRAFGVRVSARRLRTIVWSCLMVRSYMIWI